MGKFETKQREEVMKPILITIVGLVSIYGLWLVGKWVNYKLAYEDGVVSTIEEMVKPECLKEQDQ